MFEVSVGNIGIVHRGADPIEARRIFDYYVSLSKMGRGRAGDETVAILNGGDLVDEYDPKVPVKEEEEVPDFEKDEAELRAKDAAHFKEGSTDDNPSIRLRR